MKTQNRFLFTLTLTLTLTFWATYAQITLNQNIGESTGESLSSFTNGRTYGRAFVLQDFGITENDQFILDSVELAFRQWYGQDTSGTLRVNVYEIDRNFPNSFDPTQLIGSSQDIVLTEIPTPFTKPTPLQTLRINFDSPVVIPSVIEKVFVEVSSTVPETHFLYAAFTEGETDSAYHKDSGSSEYTKAISHDKAPPSYHIKAFGKLHRISDYRINYISACSDLSASFDLSDNQQIATVNWDFGDPASAANNSSTDLNPHHEFSSGGTYTVTAQITTKAWRKLSISTTLNVAENIVVYPMDDVLAFETISETGASYGFDSSLVESVILGGQNGWVVSYFDEQGNALSGPMRNFDVGRETITARVAHPKNPGCYKEMTFNLIIPPPSLALSSLDSEGPH